MEKEKTRSAMPVASFVLGIISILGFGIYYITLVSGILAIVFGVKSKKKFKSKLGLTGMILGIIGLSIFVIVYGLFISVIVRNNI